MVADVQGMLEELEVGRLAGVTQLSPTATATGPKPMIHKISYTHDAMIDLIIANPAISGNQLAAHFGYTPAWISTVRCSDAFKARLAHRRNEIIDPQLIASVELQFQGVAARSLEILQEKLSQPTQQISDQTCLRALELSSRALGYGASHQAAVNVQINVDNHLEQLGGNLTKLLQRKKEEVALGRLPVPMEDEGDE